MAIQLERTGGMHAQFLKVLVYGQAGAGKTSLIATAPTPVVLSAEAGLLSIADADIPFIRITDMNSLYEAYEFVTQDEEGKQFETICLDSVSEIAEKVLAFEKKTNKDPRKAYGAMQDEVTDLIRAFRDIPDRHVYFTAKMEKVQDESGRILYGPMMPGKNLAQQVPYFFDEVMALRVENDEDGNTVRALQTDTDGLWQAKDRSGRLEMWEAPNLGDIIDKIRGKKTGSKMGAVVAKDRDPNETILAYHPESNAVVEAKVSDLSDGQLHEIDLDAAIHAIEDQGADVAPELLEAITLAHQEQASKSQKETTAKRKPWDED